MNQFLSNASKNYDLEERTAKLSEKILELVKNIKVDDFNRNILLQLTRAITSIGANYYEANASSSRKDFRNKIYISKKEINESKYWLRLLAKYHPELRDKIAPLWKETHELHLIFQTITYSLDNPKKQSNSLEIKN